MEGKCLVGWGTTPTSPTFGNTHDVTSVKAKIVTLIASVRTLMRSMSFLSFLWTCGGAFPQAVMWPVGLGSG